LALAIFVLTACDQTRFVSTWHPPNAASVNLQHKSAAAFLISGNESVRRNFELTLSNELRKRGIEANPGYEALPNADVTNKDQLLSELKSKPIDLAVFMRIVDQHQEVTFIPTTWYPGPYYDPFFWRGGQFYGPDWGGVWPAYYDQGYYQTDTIVSVSTTIYSVSTGQILWTGTSRTVNPSKIDGLVKEVASETVKKLKDIGMLRASA
jgi:hypothetical protein